MRSSRAASAGFGETGYEAFLAGGDPGFAWQPPADEWQAIALNYTSGTTGNPKGVVYQHRGAYLNSLGNVIAFGLNDRAVYLWTLPMFHCNGWSYPWAVTAVGGTHVCLRKVAAAAIFEAIAAHRVTHLCAAPTILSLLIHAPDGDKRRFDHVVEIATGGAAPPSAVIAAMERLGFRVTHLYGLTESFGPATICQWQTAWETLDLDARAGRMARQGVAHPTLEAVMVADPATLAPGAGRRRDHRRDHAAQQHRHEGLSEEPRRDRRGVPRRLVPYRRSRRAAPRRLCRGQGPDEGRDHLGRREYLGASSSRS